MAKQGKNKNTPQKKAIGTIKKPLPKKETRKRLLQQLDDYFKKNSKVFFIISCLFAVAFAIFLFDVKMSDANDDSEYVEGGWKIMHDFHNIFAAKAPFYPMFLSVFITLFGLNIILLKSINVAFILLHIVILYYAFKDRISYFVLMLVMLTISVNSFFQYFASQTFTEAIFLVEQALLVFFVAKLYDKLKDKATLKDTWVYFLLIGLITFILSITRNIAILGIAAVILFFIVDRKFLQAAYSLVAFLLFRIPFQVITSLLIGNATQYSSQSTLIMQVDAYNPSKGMETLSGFVNRFFENGNLYISKRIFQILGFKSISVNTTSGFLVFLCAVTFIIAVILIFKNKNKVLLFAAIYISVMMAGTFVALQIQWDQPRLVMIYVPYILLIVFGGYYYWLKDKSSAAQLILICGLITVFVAGFLSTMKKSLDNYPILKKNLAGDIYYGYTEDWVNYLKMSKYCADSLPPGSFVAARKAPMSFIYSKGKEFFPVYSAFSSNPDTVLATFKKNKVTHVILASLRRNPKVNDGQLINTLHRLLYPIAQKYPGKIVMVKQIGDSEPASLYKINY